MLPKIGVGAVIFDKYGRVLLGYRKSKLGFYESCWFIPCGSDYDEEPKDAIVRELKEEANLEIKVIKEVYNKPNERGIPEIAYSCRIVKGKLRNNEPDKCGGLEYFELDNLPKNTGRRTLEILRKAGRYAYHYRI